MTPWRWSKWAVGSGTLLGVFRRIWYRFSTVLRIPSERTWFKNNWNQKGQSSKNENNIQVTKQLKFHSSLLMATKSCSREVTLALTETDENVKSPSDVGTNWWKRSHQVTSALTKTDENVKSPCDNRTDTNWWNGKHRLSWHNDKLFPLHAEGTIYKHLEFFSHRAIMSSTWRQCVRNET
jgi:hypothetical protein